MLSPVGRSLSQSLFARENSVRDKKAGEWHYYFYQGLYRNYTLPIQSKIHNRYCIIWRPVYFELYKLGTFFLNIKKRDLITLCTKTWALYLIAFLISILYSCSNCSKVLLKSKLLLVLTDKDLMSYGFCTATYRIVSKRHTVPVVENNPRKDKA